LSIVLQKTDRRIVRTRQAIHEAFTALFAETHDFERMTVQDIAERAGVNRATFYAHFEDKYALLDDFIGQQFDERLRASLPANHQGIVGVHTLMRITCELVKDLLISCAPHRQSQHGALMIRQIQSCVRDVIRKDMVLESPSQPPHDLEISFRSWAVFGAAFDWAQDPGRGSAQSLADDVTELVQNGIASGRTHCLASPISA
jgi:AcrR family transcriptional regulator